MVNPAILIGIAAAAGIAILAFSKKGEASDCDWFITTSKGKKVCLPEDVAAEALAATEAAQLACPELEDKRMRAIDLFLLTAPANPEGALEAYKSSLRKICPQAVI